MTLTQWLRSCFAPRPTSSRKRLSPRRLGLECLEDRVTPSTGGLLDPSFGSGGQVLTSFSNNYDSANAVAVQPDGKIVVAGSTKVTGSSTGFDFLVARYNANGTLDTGFGTGGHTATDFSKGSDIAYALAFQPQASGPSKILAAGSAVVANSADIALARYNANGSLDTTFGSKGKVTTNLGGNESGRAMAVDGAGRILVLSSSSVLLRYTANGALDITFGNHGQVVTPTGGNGPQSIALQADGKIVLGGTRTDPATGTPEFAVARFTANGTLDTAFGSGGLVTTHPGNYDTFSGVAIQGDGRIVLAGFESGNDPDGVDRQGEYLLRYNTDGTLDTGFGSGGVEYLVNPAGLLGNSPGGVAVQSDGQIVAGGQFAEEPSGQNYFAVLRVSSSSVLDTGYGSGGWAATQFGYGTDLHGMALEPDGRVVLAGIGRPSGTTYPTDVALARFLPSAPQVGSFTASPNPVSAGSSVTLTAGGITDGNPGATVTQVAFYADSNGDGVLDAGDAVLGYGTRNGDGTWSLTFSTAGWAAGSYTLFAQATDSYGAVGDPLAATLQVI
jgi:uncharacterized delta-60 repeat protein